VLGFHPEHREVLMTTSVTSGMAGDLCGMTLPDRLGKRIHAIHQLPVGLIRIRHEQFLDKISDIVFPEAREICHYVRARTGHIIRR
jgi:hypothetical protein